MREILFRGKRDGDGEWVMGDRAGYSDYVMIWDLIDKGVGYLVDPATVGQFTGLTDKNGKKIFEGDILRDGLGDDGVVTYFESIASFKYQVGNEVWNLNEGDPNRSTQLQYTEIIGNIHDTPDLETKEESE